MVDLDSKMQPRDITIEAVGLRFSFCAGLILARIYKKNGKDSCFIQFRRMDRRKRAILSAASMQ